MGQAEVEVASLADTTLVLVAPGMGDAIQAAKAGILEVADIFVVNKADKPGAQEAVQGPAHHDRDGAARRGGVEAAHRDHDRGEGRGDRRTGRASGRALVLAGLLGQRDARRRARAREEITAIAVAELRQRVGGLPGDSRLDALAAQVAAGDLDPFAAADELIAAASGA